MFDDELVDLLVLEFRHGPSVRRDRPDRAAGIDIARAASVAPAATAEPQDCWRNRPELWKRRRKLVDDFRSPNDCV
jgi:hypothetical protein